MDIVNTEGGSYYEVKFEGFWRVPNKYRIIETGPTYGVPIKVSSREPLLLHHQSQLYLVNSVLEAVNTVSIFSSGVVGADLYVWIILARHVLNLLLKWVSGIQIGVGLYS